MSYGVDQVTVRFGRRLALEGVTVSAAGGLVTAVIGGDGAGKSTLLRVLVGLSAPEAGAVRRPGRRQIGYLAAGSGTYGDLSVGENLAFSAAAYGVSPGRAERRVASLLERTGLGQVRHRLAGELSGGMRQKLGLVKAMLHQPDLLVLDEPTTGIDPVSRADLWWLIATAALEGAAVVLTTTYVNEAERASEVVLLDSGRVLVSGRPADIVAAVPGTIARRASAPEDDDVHRAWRRAREWRVWSPGGAATEHDVVTPDLTDAVIVATLGAEQPVSPAPS